LTSTVRWSVHKPRLAAGTPRWLVPAATASAMVAPWIAWRSRRPRPFLFFGVFAMAISGAMLWFFRDPDRETAEDGVISGADGLVQSIDVQQDGRIRVSVFMNPLNVHVNRAPLDGRVASLTHVPGGFLPALDKESERNERLVWHFDTEHGDIEVVQIAGAMVRRIVPYLGEGDKVERGQRIGLIKFGSRFDVYLPVGSPVGVAVGDKTVAGVTRLDQDEAVTPEAGWPWSLRSRHPSPGPQAAGPSRRLSVADLFTLANAACGFLAICSIAMFVHGTLALSGPRTGVPGLAVLLLILGSVLDLFDGQVARKFGSSTIGAHLDNLADAVTFGLAPAFLVEAWTSQAATSIAGHVTATAAPGIYVLAVLVRLARFASVPPKDTFTGMPCAMAALTVGAMALLKFPVLVCMAVIIVLAALMVSAIAYPKPHGVMVVLLGVWSAVSLSAIAAYALGLDAARGAVLTVATVQILATLAWPVCRRRARHVLDNPASDAQRDKASEFLAVAEQEIKALEDEGRRQ
jgi:phosphatidylserine decarboxylase